MFLLKASKEEQKNFGKNWGWFVAWGLLLVVLGIIAIAYSGFTTIVSVEFLGILLAISGGILLVDTFQFWLKKSGFFIHLLLSIVYLAIGIVFITKPVLGSLSLTFLLAISFIVIGAFRIYYSFALNQPRSGWSLFNGIVSLLLGILIFAQWPSAALFIIGLFVGIDLIFAGWSYIMAGIFVKKLA